MVTTKEKREKILMIFVLYATFAKRDVNILAKTYDVDTYRFNTSKKYFLPFTFLKQFFFLAFNLHKYKAVVIQSSGYLSFLPVIFGKLYNKPIVIIAIGTDCARLPEINYGSHDKKIIAWFTRYSFKRAKLILPVHKSLTESKYTYVDVKYPQQGIKAFCPNIKTEIVEMVNGYNTEKWKLLDLERPSLSFLTVTFAVNEVGYYRKGIDVIVKTAKAFPDYQFTIVGKVFMKEQCPSNIKLINNVSQDELLEIYNSSKYYLQLSMFEGFPNALCEAMLCGCIPIGTDVAAIPDIISDRGYILKHKNERAILELFGSLNQDITPKSVRSQITENFPLKRRSSEFLNHIKAL